MRIPVLAATLLLPPALLFSAFLAAPPSARAADDDIPISVGDGGQGSPAVGYDPVSEQFLAIFVDDRTGEIAIWGQRLEDLALAGENFCISSGPSHRFFPRVAPHPLGWLVTWRQQLEGTIVGQVISRDGALLGEPMLLVTLLDRAILFPFAVDLSGDGHVVLFSDRPEDTEIDIYLYAVHVSTDGSVSERRLVSPAEEGHGGPDVARDPVTGRSLVIWSEDRRPDHTLFGRWLSPEAIPLGEPFVVDRSPFGENDQCVAFGADRREFLVVWLPDDGVHGIFGRRIAASGAFVGGKLDLTPPDFTAYHDVRHLDLVHDGHSRLFRVTYDSRDARLPFERLDVVGRYLSPSGHPIGLPEVIQEYASDPVMCSGVTSKGPQILTVWLDKVPTPYDVRGRFQSDDVLGLIGAGAVGAAAGPPVDVLLVNGVSGVDRRVSVPAGDPITIAMRASPAGPVPASFVLYAWVGTPDGTTVAPHPAGLGTLCFPTPWRGTFPRPRRIWNNAGYPSLLGDPDLPSWPAPSTVLHLPKGHHVPIEVTLQGFIADHGSTAAIAASRTNAIVLEIE